MYYAQALADGLFSADDLPDEIELRQGADIEIFTKSGNQYSGDLLDIPWTIELRPSPEDPDIFVWAAVNSLGSVANDGSCLVGAYPKNDASTLTLGWDGWWTADRFADVYAINGTVVTRIVSETESEFVYSPSCVWEGGGLVLRYNGGYIGREPFTPTGIFKWTVNGNAKIGNQNTPVGSYAGGFTVS